MAVAGLLANGKTTVHGALDASVSYPEFLGRSRYSEAGGPVTQVVETFFPSLLVVLSGPSGVGKDAALAELRKLDRSWHFVVTATTRKIRSGEVHGTD
ncbi:MAG: hypothetical protein CM1200mP27_13240 [Chloroflexota bacterium]|nr:MAG: hypothetical protein CM1200mP27_13240 [Chloroflexota bacterium]